MGQKAVLKNNYGVGGVADKIIYITDYLVIAGINTDISLMVVASVHPDPT